MDQAEEAVPSVEDRIAALYSEPEEEQEPETTEAHVEPVVEGADAVETPEAPEAVDEAVLTPEQLEHFKIKVKVDGEESEVSLKEAREGYQRETDYRRKTQELAKERAEIPAKVRAEVEKKAQEYQHNVKVFYQALANLADAELVNTDWNKLANEDPAEFVKKTHRKTQFENFLKAAEGEIKKQEEAKQKEESERLAQALPQAIERLKAAIPNWGDELSQKITKSSIENYGLSKEELSGIVDDRYIRVLHDAMKFQELQKQKPLIDKKVADLPKVLKPGTQQSKTLVNSEREQQLKANLKKSGGRSEDVIALLMQRQNRR